MGVKNRAVNKNVRDTYFFHDLLNFIHATSIFLANRMVQGLSPNETKILFKELETLKDLMHDQSSNNRMKRLIKLYEVEEMVLNLGQNFLPKLKINIHTNGTMSGQKIFFKEFFFGLGNIFKNIADAQGTFCDILLENQDGGISIIIKNDFSVKEKKNGRGIGLKSVQIMMKEIGGIFCYFYQKNIWVSRIFIPFGKDK